MNVDIREYLRINPISVHELSLSDKDTDCFLFFPSTLDRRGYKAFTQKQLFGYLQKSIFGDLLDYTTEPPSIKPITEPVSISDDQFKNYIRRSKVQDFMDDFDGRLNTLESGLNNIILTLRRKGILDYAGAVELQSNNTRKVSWTTSSGFSGPFYQNMSYAEGLIWCKSTNSNISLTGGTDAVLLTQTLLHSHPTTYAEALTGTLAKKFGGQLAGKFTIGSKNILSQGYYGPTDEGIVNPDIGYIDDDILTQPLSGKNVRDWRNPNQEHNNVPPSLNIYVKYQENQSTTYALPQKAESYKQMLQHMAKSKSAGEVGYAAEAKYDSKIVSELPQYVEENLTPHDYILRLSIDVENNIKLMKQSLKMMLDIFTERTNNSLSTSDKPLQYLIGEHLDKLLFTVSEFMLWYNEKMQQLQRVEEKIELAKGFVVSVPPLNYVGRIIISYTDDTEQKVISHYGGKSWRRIENFVRGVKDNDPQNIPGHKFGEEFVELRESNVPTHGHSETLSAIQTPTIQEKWIAVNKSGSTTVVNSPDKEADSISTLNVNNTQVNYQISPLEYQSRGTDNPITLPHDNMPPYLKVYIWECTALTEEEKSIIGVPNDNLCVVTWLKNNGQEPIEWTRTIGTTIGDAPEVSRSNYDFVGWKCPDGRIADKKSNKTVGQPVYIGDTVIGNSFYIAQWKPTKYIVRFESNHDGVSPSVMTREYTYGEQIGYFPTFDEYPDNVSVSGWKTKNGQQVNEEDQVKSNLTLQAQWSNGN